MLAAPIHQFPALWSSQAAVRRTTSSQISKNLMPSRPVLSRFGHATVLVITYRMGHYLALFIWLSDYRRDISNNLPSTNWDMPAHALLIQKKLDPKKSWKPLLDSPRSGANEGALWMAPRWLTWSPDLFEEWNCHRWLQTHLWGWALEVSTYVAGWCLRYL